mmetsp:Transcript_19029/g.43525  ORF Transcript_19029/g.43525 Transcript_19029/m.43525 type:complete len:262 (-) Transcript_19029:344-1129(-)
MAIRSKRGIKGSSSTRSKRSIINIRSRESIMIRCSFQVELAGTHSRRSIQCTRSRRSLTGTRSTKEGFKTDDDCLGCGLFVWTISPAVSDQFSYFRRNLLKINLSERSVSFLKSFFKILTLNVMVGTTQRKNFAQNQTEGICVALLGVFTSFVNYFRCHITLTLLSCILHCAMHSKSKQLDGLLRTTVVFIFTATNVARSEITQHYAFGMKIRHAPRYAYHYVFDTIVDSSRTMAHECLEIFPSFRSLQSIHERPVKNIKK